MTPQSVPRGPERFAHAAGVAAVTVGAVVLLGWTAGVEWFKRVVPGWEAMRVDSALCFLLSGVSLLALLRARRGPSTPRGAEALRASRAAAAFVAVVGVLTLLLHAASLPPNGGMSPASAAAFVLLAGALLLAWRGRARAFQYLALFAALYGWLGIIRCTYGDAAPIAYAPTAAHSAGLFLVLGVGVLLARPDAPLVALVRGETAGASIARRLLPPAVVVPPVLGWLRLKGESAGWFGTDTGTALFALTNVIVFGALIVLYAALLDRSAAERRRTIRALRRSDARTRAIVEVARDGIVTMDLNGRIVGFNPAAEQIFGRAAVEAVGRSLLQLIDPAVGADAAGLAQCLSAGEGAVFERWIEVYGLRGDGAAVPLELNVSRMSAGGAAAFIGFVRDPGGRKKAELALRESEERFRSMADSAPVLIWVSGTDRRCTWFNRRWLEFVGRGMEEEIGDGWTANVHPEDLDRCLRTYVAAFDARRDFTMEYRLRRHDGAWRWILDNGVPRLGPDGAFLGYIGSCTDVTEPKRTQQQLQEKEELLQQITDTIDDVFWVSDPREKRLRYLSPAFERVFGGSVSSLDAASRTWDDAILPEDRARVAHASRHEEEPGAFDQTYRIVRADGAVRWIRDRGFPVHDADGAVVRVVGSAHDVTFLREAEEKQRAQLERLDLLHQITRAIGERQDLRSIFQVVVRRIERDLPVDFACVCLYDETQGVLTAAAVGVHNANLARSHGVVEEARVPIDHELLRSCVRGVFVYDGDVAPGGTSLPGLLACGGLQSFVAAPLLVESRVFGALVVARRGRRAFSGGDREFLRQLSEHVALATHQAGLYGALRRAYDDLRQTQGAVMRQERLRALGQMASGIAHDINNALSPAALYVESVLHTETELSEGARERLTTVGRAIEDVAEIVDRMRDFYRRREQHVPQTPVALNVLVQQVVDLTRARWRDIPQERGIVVRTAVELDPDLPLVFGAESELREAMTNLVFNAVDAMPTGGTLTLRTKSGTGADRTASVEVSDTGVGMDEATRGRCLDPFFTTKGDGGTGLGLAMVYGTAQRHEAALQIESEPGAGTTVRLVFPVPADAWARTPAARPESETPTRRRVLLVDDDPLVLDSLRRTLEGDAHFVVTTGGGRSGIETFRAAHERGEPFDVVITDLGMPHVDGRQVARAVKSVSPRTPVILLTGWGRRLVAEGDIPDGVDHVLDKPPKLRELREALAAAAQPTGATS